MDQNQILEKPSLSTWRADVVRGCEEGRDVAYHADVLAWQPNQGPPCPYTAVLLGYL